MRWLGWMFAMSMCIAMVGCGASTSQQSASIWQMSQDDFTADAELQNAQMAKLDSLGEAVDRLANRLDDQQRTLTSVPLEPRGEVMQADTDSSLSWGYQTVSLQTSAPEDLKEYLDDKFAALQTKIEDSCNCDRPVMSAQAPAVTSPELFDPPPMAVPAFSPSTSDRIVSSRIISVGEPRVVSVGQPVSTSYSIPMSSGYSSPVLYGSSNPVFGITSTNSGTTMSCQNGVCRMIQRPSGFQRMRTRSRR